MNENIKILWLLGLIYLLYQIFQNVRKIKSGNKKEIDHYDENSGMAMDQKSGLIENVFLVCALIIGYILINYFDFK